MDADLKLARTDLCISLAFDEQLQVAFNTLGNKSEVVLILHQWFTEAQNTRVLEFGESYRLLFSLFDYLISLALLQCLLADDEN